MAKFFGGVLVGLMIVAGLFSAGVYTGHVRFNGAQKLECESLLTGDTWTIQTDYHNITWDQVNDYGVNAITGIVIQ